MTRMLELPSLQISSASLMSVERGAGGRGRQSVTHLHAWTTRGKGRGAEASGAAGRPREEGGRDQLSRAGAIHVIGGALAPATRSPRFLGASNCPKTDASIRRSHSGGSARVSRPADDNDETARKSRPRAPTLLAAVVAGPPPSPPRPTTTTLCEVWGGGAGSRGGRKTHAGRRAAASWGGARGPEHCREPPSIRGSAGLRNPEALLRRRAAAPRPPPRWRTRRSSRCSSRGRRRRSTSGGSTAGCVCSGPVAASRSSTARTRAARSSRPARSRRARPSWARSLRPRASSYSSTAPCRRPRRPLRRQLRLIQVRRLLVSTPPRPPPRPPPRSQHRGDDPWGSDAPRWERPGRRRRLEPLRRLTRRRGPNPSSSRALAWTPPHRLRRPRGDRPHLAPLAMMASPRSTRSPPHCLLPWRRRRERSMRPSPGSTVLSTRSPGWSTTSTCRSPRRVAQASSSSLFLATRTPPPSPCRQNPPQLLQPPLLRRSLLRLPLPRLPLHLRPLLLPLPRPLLTPPFWRVAAPHRLSPRSPIRPRRPPPPPSPSSSRTSPPPWPRNTGFRPLRRPSVLRLLSAHPEPSLMPCGFDPREPGVQSCSPPPSPPWRPTWTVWSQHSSPKCTRPSQTQLHSTGACSSAMASPGAASAPPPSRSQSEAWTDPARGKPATRATRIDHATQVGR